MLTLELGGEHREVTRDQGAEILVFVGRVDVEQVQEVFDPAALLVECDVVEGVDLAGPFGRSEQTVADALVDVALQVETHVRRRCVR